ncbi:MAG TPA: hypothetical protein PLD27_05730 [bacterium]|nr:hypothetical protein [bacterium]HOL47302.1 hypothetical protein [bacterium]HPQ17639.1 hypothetical protein [bacterium]
MEWKFDNINNVWELVDNSEVFCKIVIQERKNNPKNKYRVKVIIHKMLCGKKRYKELEKKKNTWYSITEKKFKNIKELEKYINIKKKELIDYFKHI